MKKMMRFVKGKGKDKESDRRSVSSFGSRSSLAMSTSQLNMGKRHDKLEKSFGIVGEP